MPVNPETGAGIAAWGWAVGSERVEVACSFAIHQPNPRLVDLFARQAQISPAKIPKVATKFGNLGTSTCGVALGLALDQFRALPREARGPLFLAAVAPGLTWGGGLLYG